ncbi:MAG: hypothetical protein RBS85_03895 [Methanofastidiosum sp.]|nr:hypothetical protein [Methanofastidiosum sp.]
MKFWIKTLSRYELHVLHARRDAQEALRSKQDFINIYSKEFIEKMIEEIS